jgi:hypothetical protein
MDDEIPEGVSIRVGPDGGPRTNTIGLSPIKVDTKVPDPNEGIYIDMERER